MARRDYVVEGAMLECTLGTVPGEMVVTSQQKVKIKNKLKVTSEDKMPKPPFFGSCTCSSPNPPCSPVFQEWKMTSDKARMGNKQFVIADSKIQCGKGGTVTIKDTGQKLVGTGKEELELDEKYPELKGEIIFANGYFSMSLGGIMNAVFDKTLGESSTSAARGHNVDGKNKINEQDIQLSRENDAVDQMTSEELEADRADKDINIYYPKVSFEDAQVQFPIGMFPGIPNLPPLEIKIPTIEQGTIDIELPSEIKPIPWLTKQETKNFFWGF